MQALNIPVIYFAEKAKVYYAICELLSRLRTLSCPFNRNTAPYNAAVHSDFFMTEEISLLTLTTSFMFDVIKGMHAKAVYNYVFMQLSQIFPCAAIFYKDIS